MSQVADGLQLHEDKTRHRTSCEHSSPFSPPLRRPAGEAQPLGDVPAVSGCIVGCVSKAKALRAYVSCLLRVLFLSREPPEINVFCTTLLSVELIFCFTSEPFLCRSFSFRPPVVVFNSDLPSVIPAARKSFQFKSELFFPLYK